MVAHLRETDALDIERGAIRGRRRRITLGRDTGLSSAIARSRATRGNALMGPRPLRAPAFGTVPPAAHLQEALRSSRDQQPIECAPRVRISAALSKSGAFGVTPHRPIDHASAVFRSGEIAIESTSAYATVMYSNVLSASMKPAAR